MFLFICAYVFIKLFYKICSFRFFLVFLINLNLPVVLPPYDNPFKFYIFKCFFFFFKEKHVIQKNQICVSIKKMTR